ncbi:MAG: hypothetical protein ISEC1_P1521 [Thiomicrorhabdus sp.]|nr:MAG: hypothetical protein ISEC1_P1521 [Thiomicrorhabdus sp.]
MSSPTKTYQTFAKKVAVNLVTGSLGAGKTTLIRQLLSQKKTNEKWGLLVNDFGAVGIDGAIFSENRDIQVTQIPGGCICCTAKSELKTAISNLLQTQQLDRLLIEPTGLGEPDTLVDLLQSNLFAERFDIQTVFSVFDATATKVADFDEYTILKNLAYMADVIVFNKQDIAQPSQMQQLCQYAERLYPPKQKIISTQQGRVSASLLSLAHSDRHSEIQTSSHLLEGHANSSHSHSHTPKETVIPYTALELPNLIQRLYQQDLNTQSIGWIFSPNQAFDWTKLLNLFKSLNQLPGFQKVARGKGVFKVGDPWMLFQWANGQVSREYITYRRDSRLELLIEANANFDFALFEQKLLACSRK